MVLAGLKTGYKNVMNERGESRPKEVVLYHVNQQHRIARKSGYTGASALMTCLTKTCRCTLQLGHSVGG